MFFALEKPGKLPLFKTLITCCANPLLVVDNV